MSASSAGSQKKPAGRPDKGKRSDYKEWADVKKRVNEYSREKAARDANKRPSTLVVTRIVKNSLPNADNPPQAGSQNDV